MDALERLHSETSAKCDAAKAALDKARLERDGLQDAFCEVIALVNTYCDECGNNALCKTYSYDKMTGSGDYPCGGLCLLWRYRKGN